MGTTAILQVTAQEVVLQLNGLQDLGLPLVGSGYGAAESVVDSYANRAEAVALSSISELYRSMTREVRGEIVVEMAYAGQTSFSLGLYPVVANSVALYVDFGRAGSSLGTQSISGALPAVNVVHTSSGGGYGSPGRIPYTFRQLTDRLSTDYYTVDNDTGVVTLNGPDHVTHPYVLSGGSKVYADYQHTGMSRCHNLRDIVIRLAAANFGSSLGGLSDSARDYLMQMEANAMTQLYAINRGEAGIDMLDQLRLVDETRQSNLIPRRGMGLFW